MRVQFIHLVFNAYTNVYSYTYVSNCSTENKTIFYEIGIHLNINGFCLMQLTFYVHTMIIIKISQAIEEFHSLR